MRRVPVDALLATEWLSGWDYADAYECALTAGRPVTALTAAGCLFTPSRVGRLVLSARDRAVRVAGLIPAIDGEREIFPVLTGSDALVVLGLDDRHLDFRIFVAVEAGRVRCTSVVRRHNALGHAYFAVVAPFHRLIVPQMLARASRRGWRASVPTSSAPTRRDDVPRHESVGSPT